MQTIKTTYFGPRNRLGARIIAKASGGFKRSFSYEHGMNVSKNHLRAAQMLASELKWDGQWISGELDANSEIWVRSLIVEGELYPNNFTVAREG